MRLQSYSHAFLSAVTRYLSFLVLQVLSPVLSFMLIGRLLLCTHFMPSFHLYTSLLMLDLVKVCIDTFFQEEFAVVG